MVRTHDVLEVIFHPELTGGDRLSPDDQGRLIELRDGTHRSGTVRRVIAGSLQDALVRQIVWIGEVHRIVALCPGLPVHRDCADGNIHTSNAHGSQQGREVSKVVPLVALIRNGVAALRVAPAALDDRLNEVDVESLERVGCRVPGFERRKRRVGPQEKLRDAFCRRREDEPTDSHSRDK